MRIPWSARARDWRAGGRRWRTLACSSRSPLVVLLATCAIVSAPSAQDDARAVVIKRDLGMYHLLLTAYRTGESSAIDRVLLWETARLADVVANVDGPLDGVRPWESQRYMAAAMLHTDAAVRLFESGSTQFDHLELASRLLHRGGAPLGGFASRWYFALTRFLRGHGWFAHADRLLEVGRKRMPGDAAMLCESGTLAELLSSERTVRKTYDGPVRPDGGFLLETFAEDRRTRLRQAARWLGDALEAGSTDVLCRLHLGRALSLLGEYRRADPILRELQDGEDDALAYLASMFLGAVAERRGALDEAERCYRRALARFERGQSAYVALSGLLVRAGRITEARELLARTVDAEEHSRREPWWWYQSEPVEVAVARLETVRHEARR